MNRLAAALLLVAGPAAAMPRKPRMDRSMETEGSYCKVTQPGHEVVQTPEQWQALWKKIGKKTPSADLLPERLPLLRSLHHLVARLRHFAVAAFGLHGSVHPRLARHRGRR